MTSSHEPKRGQPLGYTAVSRYILDDTEEDRKFSLKAARKEATQRDAVVVELRFFEDPTGGRSGEL